MASGNKLFLNTILISLFCLTGNVDAKIILSELLAKQAVGNIRFLSQSGKFTYYQKNSGSLLFSSNYKVFEMLKGPTGTQYSLIGTSTRKKIAITQNINFNTFYSLRSKENIFLVDYGGTEVREVGKGSNIQLHQEDTWISYYDFYTRTLTFESTANSATRFNIKLNNRSNPYFTPQVVMSDQDTVYYTDLGENGITGLLQYKRTTNKSELIYKLKNPMIRAEICLNNNQLIMSMYGLNFSKEGSVITKINLPFKDFTSRESIYSSNVNDIGQLVCDFKENSIVFIKNFGTNDQMSPDVVELDLKTKETNRLSEMFTITSLLNMDGTLLALDKGKYFIVKGSLDFKNIDSLKSLPPGGFGEAIKKIDQDLSDE